MLMKLEKIISQNSFTKEEIIFLLGLSDSRDVQLLLIKSKEIKEYTFGKDVLIRGVIKFSNYCTRLCNYCGLRENNFASRRYRLSPDEILSTAKTIYERGVRTIFLQSGQDSYYDTDVISHIVYSIKKEFDVAVTLNIGERSFEEYKLWKIAGADRYFLKHDTANPDLYSEYHSRSNYRERINHIKYLKHLGYQIGTGNIIGLPKQELSDIADDVILCKEIDVNMLSIGPFIPAKFTPYESHVQGDLMLTLKTIAVARLVLQNINISATAALDSIDKNGREKGLSAGANIILANFTPFPYRELYQVYSNRSGLDKDPLDNHELIKSRIESTGSTYR
jgi:biotin synthase